MISTGDIGPWKVETEDPGILDGNDGTSCSPPEVGGTESSQERMMASISISTAGSVTRDAGPELKHTMAFRK